MGERGRRRRVGATLMLGGLILLAGCGKGDEEAERPAPLSYVPAGLGGVDSAAHDTTAVDTAATASGNAGEAAAGAAAEPAQPAPQPAVPKETLSSAAPGASAAQPAPRPRDAAREPAAGGPFSLQLGSFRSLDNARALVARIEAQGYSPVLESVVLGGETHHRVLLRGLASRAEASRTGEALRARLGITYLIRQSD